MNALWLVIIWHKFVLAFLAVILIVTFLTSTHQYAAFWAWPASRSQAVSLVTFSTDITAGSCGTALYLYWAFNAPALTIDSPATMTSLASLAVRIVFTVRQRILALLTAWPVKWRRREVRACLTSCAWRSEYAVRMDLVLTFYTMT